MSVDLAWQVTTGRPDVLIAVLDSGIRWDDVGAMHDLARKVHLNRGELPLPRDAAGHTKPESSAAGAFLNPDPYDLNDDGVFDVADYANRRARPRPERQRAPRSAGSDPDVQRRHRRRRQRLRRRHRGLELPRRRQRSRSTRSRTATAPARREDSTAEADNGSALGTCPNCLVMPVRVGDSFVADSNLFAQGVVFAVDSGAHVVQEALGAVNNTSFARAAIEYA